MYCYFKCSVALPHVTMGWSAVCHCGIFWSHSLAFCSNDDPRLPLTYIKSRSNLLPKAPVTPGPVSTALAQGCLNFQRCEMSRKSWNFSRKMTFTVSLQQPWRFYRARTVFYLGTRNACTVLTRRPYCADGVLKTQCRDFPAFPKFWLVAFWILENNTCAMEIMELLLGVSV